MYFGTKSYLKNNRNHTAKHVSVTASGLFIKSLSQSSQTRNICLKIKSIEFFLIS
jgi:hypothetical protein